MRLLLVDDDEIFRCLLVNQLSRAGHSVDEAGDGVDALAKINAEMYDAVICDWEMPRLDGPALCRMVRAGRHGRELYFIMLSGRSTAIEQADGYDAGVDAFLTKPCDHTELLAALRTAQSIAEMPVRKAS
jgi:sigma-B regulation protein RsbU (phosphoserine phosphatase)